MTKKEKIANNLTFLYSTFFHRLNWTARTNAQLSLNRSLSVPYFRTQNPPTNHHPPLVTAKAQNLQFEEKLAK